MNQQNSRGNAKSRRKNGRRKRQESEDVNSNSNGINHEELNEESSEQTLKYNEQERESLSEQPVQQSNDKHEEESFHSDTQKEHIISSPRHTTDGQESPISVKQRNKMKSMNKYPNLPVSKQEHIVPLKPQASVAPVKQAHSSPANKNLPHHTNSPKDMHSKSNGHMSPSHNMCTYSAYNPLPPRFQQQLLQREAASAARRYRKRRGPLPPKRSSYPPNGSGRSDEFVPPLLPEQQEYEEFEQEEQIEDNQAEQPGVAPQQQECLMNNGYSSESDFLTDSPSTGRTTSISPLLSTSAGSQSSLQRLDLVRSLATSHGLLDELITIFDTIAFSSEELQIILNKIATKHSSDKHDLHRLISSAKHDKTFERILEETYRSQAKILAIELQAEKNRVLELAQSNIDLENTIRQLQQQQQQQQQQQPNNVVQYEQMILSYQMQLRRLADENARLQHQLHAYSMMPPQINELKQQQHVLNEQLRQMTIRNSALENEAAESERASKHAAEIYKRADTQKQERIEQMIADINKYKKLDKELTNLRQRHSELDKSLNEKINEISQQRDDLREHCNQLKQQVKEYEQLQTKYDKVIQTQSNNATHQIQQEINNLKVKNDELRQRNWKIMEELNKSLHEEQQNQSIKSS